MANWRDSILKNFKPKISRLTLVADPDGLLTEEGMLAAIRDRGFDLIPFDDPIAFRYAYESQYRSQWDKGQNTDLVVVLRSAEQQLNKLPFDLLKAGRPLTFALHQLFPKLNYPVIAGLDRAYLDAVDEAYQKQDGDQLIERETKDFVLTHCFRIVPKLIEKPVDLMKVLLSLHSRKVRLPDFLVDYLLESLTKDATFETWPLADILPSRESFLRFLQDEWKAFLTTQAQPSQTCRVPFSHEDVRAYIDTFFLEGSLTPVEHENVAKLPAWAQTGVVRDPGADAMRRFRGLWRNFEAEIPSAGVPHREWQQAAERWAELVVMRWEWDESLAVADRTAWSELQSTVEDAFGAWMMQRYGSLHNLPYHQQPVMVHQVPRFMAVERTRKKISKIALLVLDGLAFDQWLLLKKSLEFSDKAWQFRESTAFAWVPTLTSVTRQSIFAGEPPLYFPDSLLTTAKEKAHWLRFWEDQGVQRASIDLVTSFDGPNDSRLETALGNPRLSVLGIVWNKVDDIMHGMQMQTAGMHNQVRLWASQGHLQQLLARLHDEGFVVYLTADHGNVTATGIGNPREGVLVETKGKRVRVYDRTEFLDEVAGKFPESVRWTNHGLPPAQYVLLAGDLRAFADVGDEVVSHGGIALEEVMVPFVAITRESA
jgi:PglZ domain